MTLPADVARCPGYWSEGWREGCDGCMRRAIWNADGPYTVWITPPPIVVFECEARIAPEDDK